MGQRQDVAKNAGKSRLRKRAAVRLHLGKEEFLARVVDVGCLAGTMWMACLLYPLYEQSWEGRHTLACAVGVGLLFLAGEVTGLYRADRGEPLGAELARVWNSWFMVVAGLTFLAFVTKTSEVHSRFVTLVWFALAPVAICCWRVVLNVSLGEARARGRNTRRAAIAGLHDTGRQLARSIERSPRLGMHFVGFFDDRCEERLNEERSGLSELRGNFEQLVDGARRGDIDVVYVALPPHAQPRINALIRELGDTTASVYLAYDFGNIEVLHAYWTSLGGVPLLSVVENPFDGIVGWAKRLEDFLLGACLMAVAAIPMLLIALAIKLTSPGPVFFRQRRYGLNGEEIRMLKFRTMTVCEDGDRVVQTTKNDPRVTRVGALLRRWSLDELPQLLQVLSGTMSLVGPRPHAVAHNEQYRKLIPGYMRRYKVKPGITGWAQVNGWRGETETVDKMQKRVEFDLEYIRNWEFSLDLKIIALTALAVIIGKNAY